MNDRERKLMLAVGGLVVVAAVYFGLGRFNDGVATRKSQLKSKQTQREQMFEQQMQGEWANRQFGEYAIRSLPADVETAARIYGGWLLDAAQRNGLQSVSVDRTQTAKIYTAATSGSRPNTAAGPGLYNQLSFSVRAQTQMDGWVQWMHEFYAKDYLHRIRSWSLTPLRNGGFNLEMTIDALAISGTSTELPERSEPSYRVDGDLTQYSDTVLNRNLFQPPNAEPKFSGNTVVSATTGKPTVTPLTFEDPESQTLAFKLIDAPEGRTVRLDERTGALTIDDDAAGEYPVKVQVTDDGYPRRTVTQDLTVKVTDPPPPDPEPPTPLKFDDAKQTALTGLTQGRGGWTVWMHVRTRDKTLKLKVGDEFEIGSVKGTVVDVTSRAAILEVDGKRYQFEQAALLKETIEGDSLPVEESAAAS